MTWMLVFTMCFGVAEASLLCYAFFQLAEGISVCLAAFRAALDKFRTARQRFADVPQLGAGDNVALCIHDTHDKRYLILYFQQYALKQSCCHSSHPLVNLDKSLKFRMDILHHDFVFFNKVFQIFL